jgi:hypothetical protein
VQTSAVSKHLKQLPRLQMKHSCHHDIGSVRATLPQLVRMLPLLGDSWYLLQGELRLAPHHRRVSPAVYLLLAYMIRSCCRPSVAAAGFNMAGPWPLDHSNCHLLLCCNSSSMYAGAAPHLLMVPQKGKVSSLTPKM